MRAPVLALLGLALPGLALLLLALCAGCAVPAARSRAAAKRAPAELDACDVVWTSPSRDASGSMPLGNGEVGLNAWIEENGDLVCLLSHTDAWSESNRLLKLGRVRVSLAPSPFAAGAGFEQRLRLRDGAMVVRKDGAELALFVDADAPVVRIAYSGRQPVAAKVALEIWRTQRHVLAGGELQSSWTMRDAPASIEVWEAPDVVLDAPGALAWYHRNDWSIVPLTLAHQGLTEVADRVRDPLAGRTSGGWIAAPGFERADERTLAATAVRAFDVRIAATSLQCDDPAAWESAARAAAEAAPPLAVARARTADWWDAFWSRSWVFVGGPDGARVSQAYALQRWMQACAGRGGYPIKFNGSIFTVEPRFTGGGDFDPDFRKWGGDYWWQNTRLPYYAMPASGDFEMMRPLFRMYGAALPLCAARARLYHGVSGAYFPETMTSFGSYSNGDYGWDRAGRAPAEVLCPWWQYAWNQGLELVALMLDYWDYTGDEEFLRRELVPTAAAVLDYFDTRFARDDAGRLLIAPTQALETYWTGVANDMPCVAGLHAVLARLSALPAGALASGQRARWARLEGELPPLPSRTQHGVVVLAAAERFAPERSNCEPPELYAIFPFRLYGVGKPDLERARASYRLRVDRFTNGWPQDGQFAALLGLRDDARDNVLAKVTNGNPAHRFPAMWGPNFDWLPDQCHGSNLMTTLQLMLLQCEGDSIRLFPAWPREWDVDFRLHAPHDTVVEATLRGGRVVRLVVTPPERSADVVSALD